MRWSKCWSCLYNGECEYVKFCDDYVPYGDAAENDEVDLIIETGRIEYRDAWYDYLKDWD